MNKHSTAVFINLSFVLHATAIHTASLSRNASWSFMPTPRRRHPLQLRGRSSPYSSHLLTGNHLRRRNRHPRSNLLRSILCSPRAVDLALQCAVLGALSLGAFGTVLSVGKLLSLLQEYVHRTVRPALRTVTVPESPIVVPTAAASYPGRLEIRSLRDQDELFERRIDPIEDARLYEQQRSFALLREDHTPDAEAQAEGSSDVRHDSPGDRGSAALDGRPRDCARTAWRSRPWRPTCNAFHEWRAVTEAAMAAAQALRRRRDGTHDPLLLPSGAETAPRIHWRLSSLALQGVDRVVLRQGSLSAADTSTARRLHDEAHMHARVADALTASPRIAAIFGSCGLSDLTEDGLEDNLESLGSQIALPTRDVLDRAIALTEALAALHGAEGGVAVHGALRREFFLPNGSGKLRHFYGAELLDWSAARQTYCDAPSRAVSLDRQHLTAASSTSAALNEQTDLRALASLLFVWLTGSEPAGDPEYRRQQVDERLRTGGFANDRLADLIVRAWSDKDISAFEVLRYLRDVQRAAAAAN